MSNRKISSGTVHKVPDDLRKAVASEKEVLTLWEDVTPLARNEWICWVMSAKQEKTRDRSIRVGMDKMRKGMRRPCCWAGCPHR